MTAMWERDYHLVNRGITEPKDAHCPSVLKFTSAIDARSSALVMVMVNGIGANLTNEEKRAHLIDLRREHLIEQVCIQEILPPES